MIVPSILVLFIPSIGTQLFNVYHGGTLIFDIPSVTNIIGHSKVQGIYFLINFNTVKKLNEIRLGKFFQRIYIYIYIYRFKCRFLSD